MYAKMSSDLLRGHTDTIVLSVLKSDDSYGYEICKSILEKTDNLFELKEATLYSSFRRLEQLGCISSYWGNESCGGRRKYYRITDAGLKMRERNIADWKFANKILSNLFKEELFDE
ncbi:PadR family transcriptional regulator [Clostridia bacterium]|nr:PadR family transcriptional regulator [Clostridia bacterium]